MDCARLISRTSLLLALGCGAGSSPDYTASMGYSGGGESEADSYAPPSSEESMGAADAESYRGGVAASSTSSVVPSSAAPMGAEGGASITTTTTVTVTVDTPTLPVIGEEPVVVQQQAPRDRILTAASVGDHDRRGNYMEYLARHAYEARTLGLDMSRRVQFQVVDRQGQPVPDADLEVVIGQHVVRGKTHADGGWDFYPSVEIGAVAGAARVVVRAGGVSGTAAVSIPSQGDGQGITLRLDGVVRQRPRVLDLAFLIDVTGSMEDELRYVNDEVVDIVGRIHSENPETVVRVGAVFYRDRSDSQPLQRIHFTRDVQAFANAMQTVQASGGGDYPEDLDAGLATAFGGLQWSESEAVRVLVVIADAPPQRYATSFGYLQAMREASHLGIRILPVAASGSDRQVEYLFRAMATMTSTPYVYLTDDSGVGGRHMEADTDRVAVEYFADLLTRLVVSDLQGQGMHEPMGFDH